MAQFTNKPIYIALLLTLSLLGNENFDELKDYRSLLCLKVHSNYLHGSSATLGDCDGSDSTLWRDTIGKKVSYIYQLKEKTGDK